MIVLSVGMPRAGSGWHYELVRDLTLALGYADPRRVREKYKLQEILTEETCNIGKLSARRLAAVSLPALVGASFAIKAHTPPTRASRLLASVGWLRVSYIYRDPRDALYSAMEFGQTALSQGRPNAFSYLSTFDKGAEFMMQYVRIWERWTEQKKVFVVRYEDMLSNYEAQAVRLANYLKADSARPEVRAALERHRPSPEQTALYQQKIGAFRRQFNDEQKDKLREALAPYLKRMGYEE
ncbi:MAG: sulfotransferase domain-containing protein [Anaerolineales bacterium]|nr:sulfotransferase domain-containing protein [Anaerolineales bacterium]